MRLVVLRPFAALCVVVITACDATRSTNVNAVAVPVSTTSRDARAWLGNYMLAPRAIAAGEPAVLAGAGDIARCYPGANFREFRRPGPDHPAEQTARLLDLMPGATVAMLGDGAYEFGSPLDYWGCYNPTWGRHLRRTRPAAGNHEYLTPGASGYFLYFRQRAAPPLGYYSYDLGNWHVVVLNSTPQVYLCWPPESDEVPPGFPTLPDPSVIGPDAGRACAGDAAQQLWLQADLAAHATTPCTVVYFHHPRFSSGKHGNHFQMQKIWDIIYANGVDLVLSGHDHLYERFAPQTPDGVADDVRGIRQFTVGTGGAEFYAVSTVQPNSEVIINDSHGVIALALDESAYAWAFVGVDRTIRDSGTGSCH
jgi:3',5'-cyclic AMP phosphodiesterase CpdA